MNVAIEECKEIIGHRQYWLLNDLEHREIFQFLWDDCDTLEEFTDLLYSDPNICNTKAAAWFLHYDTDAFAGFLSRWFSRQQYRFCVDSKQKFISLSSDGMKSIFPMAMLLTDSYIYRDKEDFYVAVVEDDDFNPWLFNFHSLVCGDNISVEGHRLQGNYAIYYAEGYLAFWKLPVAVWEAIMESGIYEDVHEIGAEYNSD